MLTSVPNPHHTETMKTILLFELMKYAKSSHISPEENRLLDNFYQLLKQPNPFERTSPSHIVSSSWIVDKSHTHYLLSHHRKLNLWIQLGGHNDGNTCCKEVALKEAEEESGINGYTFLTQDIFDIDIHHVSGNCHYHYDIRYLLQAPEGQSPKVSEESYDLAWVSGPNLSHYTSQDSVLRMHKKFQLFFS
jgi:hypothetical protein